jgi:hypothetical protein
MIEGYTILNFESGRQFRIVAPRIQMQQGEWNTIDLRTIKTHQKSEAKHDRFRVIF